MHRKSHKKRLKKSVSFEKFVKVGDNERKKVKDIPYCYCIIMPDSVYRARKKSAARQRLKRQLIFLE